ncbi:ELKS/Rab6-interacting/CAST family member 1-like isoform X7 [Corythoichthys intestinalis]|uniref:ELKS/Rab6-interacting/CAST family member 1-like isoform X7 n=1 Tax=Corythoichthys intestinalis TaxID=161448 RepID=UPI0025A5D186|nr:ELKS/Rab6-interacting/CAST family member 1-like isoform X7 [Corythoichthys intestinalis]
MPINVRAKPAQSKLSAVSKSSTHADGNASHSRFSRSAKQGKSKQVKTSSTPGCRSGLEPGSVSSPVSKVSGGQGSKSGLCPKKSGIITTKQTYGSATAPGGKTLSMENIQSLNAAYGTSGTYSCERDALEPSGSYPKATMTLGRNTIRSSYSGRGTGMASSPNINSTDLNHLSNQYGKDQKFGPGGTSSQQHQSGRHSDALDFTGHEESLASDLQAQLRALLRENDSLRRELDEGKDGRTGHSFNNVNSWSSDSKRDKSIRREEGARASALKDYHRADQDTIQAPLTVQELQEELRAHREMNSRLQQSHQPGTPSSCRDIHIGQDHRGGLSPSHFLRERPSNFHSPGPRQSPKVSPSNTYNPRHQEADVIIHSSGYGGTSPTATQRLSPVNTLHPGPKHSPNQAVVPSPVRRCSPCQVPGCDGFSSPPLQPSHENFIHLQSEHERQAKELFHLRKTLEEMEIRIDSQKQTLGARDESIQRLMEMLQGQGQFHGQWVHGQRTGILAMAAQEAEAQLESMHIREIENLLDQLKDKDKQLTGLKDRVQGLQTDSSNTETALATLEEALSDKERVIENLREQKERADRVQLVELERLRKDNQELKDKLSALQPQKPSPSQPAILGPNQIQRPDGEVPSKIVAQPAVNSTAPNPDDTMRNCPDIADRLRLLEQEVARHREESGKSQAEVTRLMVALKDAEMDRSGREKRINDLERQVKSPHIQKQMVPGEIRKDAQLDGHAHSLSQLQLSASQDAMQETAERIGELEKALRDSMNTSANREVLWAQEEMTRIQAQRQLEELMVALEKTRQELDTTKMHLSSTQQTLHERDGHLSNLRQEKRKQLEEILEMKQQALLAAISEKDANIALLELSPSKRRNPQAEVMALKREKDRLMHQLKQQTQSRMKMMADNYEEDRIHPQNNPHLSHHLHSANVHHRSLPRHPHANHRRPMDQEDEEGIWA